MQQLLLKASRPIEFLMQDLLLSFNLVFCGVSSLWSTSTRSGELCYGRLVLRLHRRICATLVLPTATAYRTIYFFTTEYWYCSLQQYFAFAFFCRTWWCRECCLVVPSTTESIFIVTVSSFSSVLTIHLHRLLVIYLISSNFILILFFYYYCLFCYL